MNFHFARYHEIAALVAERLASRRPADPLAAWEEEVIVPSSGGAQAVAAEAVTRCGAVAGLQIRTLESFARRLLNDAGEYPRGATDEERRLAMRTAVRSVDHPILQTRGIAALLDRSWRDVRDSGLTLDRLRERLRAAQGIRDRDRKSLLLRVWSEYERLIAATGAIDPSDLLRRAAERLRGGAAVAGQIVAGFYDVTGAQLDLLLALRDAEKLAAVAIPVGEGDIYRFAHPFLHALSAGSEADVADPRLPIREPRWSVAVHETRPAEVRAICREVADLLRDGTPPSAIGIVARALDPHDVSLFARGAGEHGFAVSSAFDAPLAAHRVARGILLLLRLHERGFPRGDVLEIVRSGLRTATKIDVDKADADTREARIAGGTSDRLRLVRHRSFAVADFIAVVEEIEPVAPQPPAQLRGIQWSEWLGDLLDRFRLDTEEDLDVAEQLAEIAALFRRADRMNVRFDAGAVIEAIDTARYVPRSDAPGDRPVVWLGDAMTFRGRTFEHLFVFGAQEDSFPQRRIEDPLLPDSDRRILGIREIGDGRDEERFLFRLLFDGARSAVRFSFARTDGFGKLFRPSQLLKNFVVSEHPERREELLKDFASAVASFVERRRPRRRPPAHAPTGTPALHLNARALQLLARAGTNGPFDGFIADPALRARFASALEAISPTQLEDFGECPQKFLLKHILGARDIDDPDRDLQIPPREKGLLAHDILETFYRALGREELVEAAAALPTLPPDLAARLDTEIDRAFDALEQKAPPLNVHLRKMERRATKRTLRDFVAADIADLAANGLFPTRFEFLFGSKPRERAPDHPEAFYIDAAGTTLRVEGRIDRIDEGEGRVRIVDYKSGKALRHRNLGEKIDQGVRLQLALYAMAVAKFFDLDPSAVSGAIKPLVISNMRLDRFSFPLGEKHDRLRETLEIFASAIANGRFPAYPNEKDESFNSCKYCPVNESCRTKHDPEERYAVTRAGDPRTLLRA